MSIELLEQFRSKVPIVAKNDIIYLNSGFQAPMNTIVGEAINNFVAESMNNYACKSKWIEETKQLRCKIAKHINANPEDIVFTKDATDSCNIFQNSIKFKEGDNVVLIKGEFPSVVAGWLALQEKGLEVRFVEVDESNLQSYNAQTFDNVVDGKTIAICISSIAFHSGLKNDIKSICDTYRPKGVHVLVDTTQEIGNVKIDVQASKMSVMASSCFKGLACPHGLGIMYIDPEALKDLKDVPPNASSESIANMDPSQVLESTSQFHTTAAKYEHQNKPFMQCYALSKYLDFIETVKVENIEKYLVALGLYLRSEMESIGVDTLGPREIDLRSPHSNIFPLHSKEWPSYLKKHGVFVTHNRCGIRVSLGIFNNKHDIDRFVSIVKGGLNKGFQ